MGEGEQADDREHDGPNIIPGLFYRDAPAAIGWLARTFGFRKLLVVPGPDGSILHAEMSFGPGVIMLGTAMVDEESKTLPGFSAPGQTGVYVVVEDIERHYERATAAGAEILQELTVAASEELQYAALDLEGHRWTFGRYRPKV